MTLITNQAFAADTWGNINVRFAFPNAAEDIDTLEEDIKENILFARSVGYGVHEDIVSFEITPSFYTTLTDKNYEDIVSQTLLGAPYIQYLLFDVSRLNSLDLAHFSAQMFKLQNTFANQKSNLKFGLKFNYSKDIDLNDEIMKLFLESPQKYSELDFIGDWATFLNNAAANPKIWSNLSDVDFIGANSIALDSTNVKTLIKFLAHTPKLRGIDLSSALLKECLCDNPEAEKKQVVSVLFTELAKHPLVSFFRLASNDLDIESATLVANIIKQLDNLVLIDVGNNHFGGQGAHDFLQSLVRHKYLTYIDISSNDFHSEHAKDYAAVLTGKSEIKYLNASYNFFAIEGTNIIRQAMSHPLILQSLQISKYRKNYDINKSDKEQNHLNFKWSGLFFDDFGQNYFVSEKSSDVFYKFAKTFQYLYLDANNLNLSPFSELAQSLIATDLVYLDLNSNNLSSTNVYDVTKILYFSPKMTGVNLENNAFVGKDMLKIAKALTSFPVLKYVALSNNEFNSDGIKTFAKYLNKDRGLRRLYLSNVELSNGAALQLFKALNNQKQLEVLDISFNDVDKSGVKTLLSSLKGKKKFNTLRLIGNKFDCDDLQEMDSSISFRCD